MPASNASAVKVRSLFEQYARGLVGELDALAGEYLDEYVGLLSSGRIVPGDKHFNDPVWKTVSLHKWEVAIVDSPLLQRLRRVRQLGVAELVFPGAGYSRFEHAIGAVQAMELLIRSIERNTEALRPDADARRMLRLAALLHDIGHCAFSHVSEEFYRDLTVAEGRTLNELRVHIEEALGHRPSPSEILSAGLLTTPAFRQLLDAANAPLTVSSVDALDWIAKLVMGAFPDPKRPMFTQMLTGPFDADKLDYMSRDCATGGIPLPVDIPRLIEKIRPISEKVGKLGKLAERFQINPDEEVTILGVELSGSRAIEEMLIARLILFDKMYFHSKVRAAEGIVRRCLEHLVSADPRLASAGRLFALDDHQLLALGNRHSINQDGQNAAAANDHYARAVKLARALSDRRLPKRAFCFAKILVPVWADEETLGWRALTDAVSDGRDRCALEDAIRERANVMLASTQEPLVDCDDVYLSKPDAARVHTSAETYLITNDKKVFKVGKADVATNPSVGGLFEVDRWADAYETNKGFGYVMCDEAVRAAVCVAAETVLAERFDLHFAPGAHEFCKLREEDLRRYRRAAHSLGLLSKLPRLVPRSDFVATADTIRRARAAAKRLAAFSGEGGLHISDERILAWINQFELTHQPSALQLVENIRLYDRSDFVQAVGTLHQRQEWNQPSAWVPLGAPNDSASYWSYYLHDEDLKPFAIQPRSLEAALRTTLPIVLFDDCVNSGGQVATIFSQWLGQLGAPTDERHVEPLPEDLRTALRERPLRLVFCVGSEAAKTQVPEQLQKLGLNVEVEIVETLPVDGFVKAGVSAEARAHFADVGFALLRSTKEPDRWSDERCRECAVGYGGSAQLFTFSMNVPTFVPPIVWSGGDYQGRSWMPLIPRRAK